MACKHLGQVVSSQIGSPQVSQVFSKLPVLVSTVAAEASSTFHSCIAALENTDYRGGLKHSTGVS